MIFYRTNRDSDPYVSLWGKETWLEPLAHVDEFRFPMILTVEPTNACQNDCLYCSRQLMTRKIGFMDSSVMEQIAIEAAKHNAAVRHGGFGEPLLHSEIVEICRTTCERDVLTTVFTNGERLSEEMMRAFVGMGLDEIRFSSSGIAAEEHNRVRKNSDYTRDLDEKIVMADRIRKEMGSAKPFLTLYSNVLDYNDENFQSNLSAYKDHYLEYVDKVDIDLTMFSRVKDLPHVQELYLKQTVNETHKKCVTLFLKLIVHWNGDVFACDRAYNYEEQYYLGRVGENGSTIEQGYASEKMKDLRENLSFAMKHQDYELCRDCYSNTTKWANANKSK